MAEDRATVPRDQFRFTIGGKQYEYRGYLSAADALLIKQHAGLTTLQLFTGLEIGDPGSVVGLVFVAKRQAGERVTWDEVVEQIDGEDDIIALAHSFQALETEIAPATSKDVKPRTRKAEAEPAA